MTSKIEVSREMAERIVKDGTISVAQIDQLRQKLAAPEAPRQEPVAYRHTMHLERGCSYRFALTSSPEHPFGEPDVDYDKSFSVTCEPLYAAPLSPDHSSGGAGVVLPEIEISPLEELRHIFDSNKGADSALVISKRLAEQILAAAAVDRKSEPFAFATITQGGHVNLYGPDQCSAKYLAMYESLGMQTVQLYRRPAEPSSPVAVVLDQIRDALNSARDAHGKMLMSNPPQEMWIVTGVDRKISEALACLDKVKELNQ